MNINRVIHINRYDFTVGGLVIITRKHSPDRNGTMSVFKLIVPQHFINDGRQLKSIGWERFKPGRSMGGDPGQ